MQKSQVFELFCAYHLGLFPGERVQFGNVHDVARAFDLDTTEVHQILADHHLDVDTLLHSGFDLAGAQADIQVSPPGVDLFALAQMHYEHARAARSQPRNWEQELAEDARINAKTFGEEG